MINLRGNNFEDKFDDIIKDMVTYKDNLTNKLELLKKCK